MFQGLAALSNSTVAAPTPMAAEDNGKVVDAGGAVGIAIGSCAAGVLLAAAGMWLHRRRKAQRPAASSWCVLGSGQDAGAAVNLAVTKAAASGGGAV